MLITRRSQVRDLHGPNFIFIFPERLFWLNFNSFSKKKATSWSISIPFSTKTFFDWISILFPQKKGNFLLDLNPFFHKRQLGQSQTFLLTSTLTNSHSKPPSIQVSERITNALPTQLQFSLILYLWAPALFSWICKLSRFSSFFVFLNNSQVTRMSA